MRYGFLLLMKNPDIAGKPTGHMEVEATSSAPQLTSNWLPYPQLSQVSGASECLCYLCRDWRKTDVTDIRAASDLHLQVLNIFFKEF